MTDAHSTFSLVANGYDPDEVERRLAELTNTAAAAQQHAHDLHVQLAEQAETVAVDSESPASQEPDFQALGAHVAKIVQVAHDAATDMRQQAIAEAQAKVAEAEAAIETLQTDAREKAEALTLAAEQQLTAARKFAVNQQAKVHDDAIRSAATLVAAAKRQAEEIVGAATKRTAQIESESKATLDALANQHDEIIGALMKLKDGLPALIGATAETT
jgi:hypothetical protein